MSRLVSLVVCLASVVATMLQATNNITISVECKSQCGELMVPYPFGIIGNKGTNCSLNSLFDITCNTSFSPPKAFIQTSNILIHNISDTQLRIETIAAYRCYNSSGSSVYNFATWTKLANTPYTFSGSNKFTVIGCNDYAVISGKDNRKSVATGCLSLCSNKNDVIGGNCSGTGCCQTSIPKGLKNFITEPDYWSSELNYTRSFTPCSYAFLAEENTFTFQGLSDFLPDLFASVPVALDWAIGDMSCEDTNFSVCQSNTDCINIVRGSNVGYRCSCMKGYEGNPYLQPGCKDIDECQDSNKNNCFNNWNCHNTPGSYTCSCPPEYTGNGWKNGTECSCDNGSVSDSGYCSCSVDYYMKNGRCRKKSQFSHYLGIVACILCIVIGGAWLCIIINQRKQLKRRRYLFKQNGGDFLREKLSATSNSIESLRIFTVQELKKATNSYATIVGQGGYGTVYKGILSDKREVAIKKSKVLDQSQREQFINEVIILTQINHRNVVKLLGCCLEDEVPLLVYEFVSNDTLFHHIHSQAGGMPWLSWDNRLRIAAESAGALDYLHSAASMPIIHRDVKSANILLDENYTTKIADFGASRQVPLDHSQVPTLVQGTLGYLDPEYFHTSQLTDKSDVYSFGVVLVELLTNQKPLGGNRAVEEMNLAQHFIATMKQKGLFGILDPRVRREGTLEQLQAVAELGKRCLSLYSIDRPTMKEVAMELEGLRKFNKHPWAGPGHKSGHEETRSLMIETNESDHYTVRQDQYSNNFGEYYSDTAPINLQHNSPR